MWPRRLSCVASLWLQWTETFIDVDILVCDSGLHGKNLLKGTRARL